MMGVKKLIGVIIFLLFIFISITACNTNVEEKIRENIIGREIKYYSITGDPLNYSISREDIISIKKTEEGWKVEIGKKIKWNLDYNEKGEFVKQEQLFQT
jgi:hypothetical protein